MKRFQLQKSRRQYSGVISVLLFLAVLFGVYTALQSLSGRSIDEQERNLIRALRQSTVQCYAVEGFYPENLDYLTKHYKIQYDHDMFFVDYQPFGQNIMPDITVIRKGKEGAG